MEERPLPATDCTKYLKSTRYIPRARDASFHPTHPSPIPIPRPSPPFLSSTSCPHLQAYGSLPPPPGALAPWVQRAGICFCSNGLFMRNFSRLTSYQVNSPRNVEGWGGGHLSPSPCRIFELLRNFFACRNFAITRLFSGMKKRKTITVQIS